MPAAHLKFERAQLLHPKARFYLKLEVGVLTRPPSIANGENVGDAHSNTDVNTTGDMEARKSDRDGPSNV